MEGQHVAEDLRHEASARHDRCAAYGQLGRGAAEADHHAAGHELPDGLARSRQLRRERDDRGAASELLAACLEQLVAVERGAHVRRHTAGRELGPARDRSVRTQLGSPPIGQAASTGCGGSAHLAR